MDTEILDILRQDFNNRISFRKKSADTYQIIAPYYHEDGDMYNIFIEYNADKGLYRVCDHGLTLMRLSYTYELDTEKKEDIFNQLLVDNRVRNDDGNLYIDVPPEQTYNAIARLTQTITKVTNMHVYRRDVVRNLFLEDLRDFIAIELPRFAPVPGYLPIAEREDLEVDFAFMIRPKNIYLFGVKDNSKARLVSISCLEYMRKNVPSRSIVVHEDFDALSAKDRRILTNVVDKQFTDFPDFRDNAVKYFERETA